MIEKQKAFDTFLEEQLNPAQKEAVVEPKGVLLVVAGAGSGKTRIITSRIVHLITKQGALPSSIVALTFTNKAAQEMQSRIAAMLGPRLDMPFIGTFHSYCLRLLKRYRDALDIPFFSILDADDQRKMLTALIKRSGMQKQVAAKQLSYQISLLKNQSIDPESAAQQDQILHEMFRAYEREKRESKCFDFDDLMLETIKLIKTVPVVHTELRAQIEHILVDEYQDTNVVQHTLLKLLAQDDAHALAVTSLCVVGDEDQSVYSWRGATVANILNFTRDFSHTKMIKVEQNYRSVQQILKVANNVIEHNTQRNPKTLWSDKKGNDRICVVTCASEYQEADVISHYIKKLVASTKTCSAAVLYRAHFQSRAIEEALIKQGIPYTIIGGIQFYERKEIKDLFAYLRLVCNPYDRTSFFRVINTPGRGLGEAFEELFYERWHREPLLTFVDVTRALQEEKSLTGKKADAVHMFCEIIQACSPSDSPSSVLEKIIVKTQYLTYLRNAYDAREADAKIENVEELMHAISHFESEQKRTVGEFLDDVALLQEKIAIAKQDKSTPVVLMTLHAAKGLEFDNVALIGLNEEVLPSMRSLQDQESLEEERRLLYVGITRARERLLISHARCRYTYGNMVDCLPSRFLREIPSNLTTKHEIAYTSESHMQRVINTWIGGKSLKAEPLMTFRPASSNPSSKKKVEVHTAVRSSSSWRMHQPVQHTKFGVGTIKKVDPKTDGKVYLTVAFKVGIKKVEASFVKKI